MTRSTNLLSLFGACLFALAPMCALAGGEARHPGAGFDQFIVRFKDGSPEHGNARARQRVLDAGAKAKGLHATVDHRMGIGADVVRLGGKLDFKGAEDFMNRLRRDPSVKYAEIDRILKPTFAPNDPLYTGNASFNQWHYYESTGGINLPSAWDLATGSGVVVAVIDTGITAHPDLDANIVAGYDFITLPTTSNDLDGRDANPSDPGDWVVADECPSDPAASNSSWHGTHVAGTIAAVTNNAIGVAGVAFNAKVMPLRVLGKCGGSTSDIDDAIVYAAGGTVAGAGGLPITNANPVEVINMSLGGAGSCSASSQAAINYAISRGVVVVVAAGNDNLDASGFEPANCNGVVVVGATQRAGARSSYSNFGPAVDVSAPGGGDGNYVLSTFNHGTTVPTTSGYAGYSGTSMAAPHVAGTVALMQSRSVASPSVVESVLKSTARALPAPCPEGCGAGIINAAAALGATQLDIDDVTAYEGNAGTKTFTFTVTLTQARPTPVTFDIATANGSAEAGSDYVALAMTGQSIPAGAKSKTFNVTVNGDTLVESTETFFINVTNVVGIQLADGQGLGTIVRDDPIPLANGVAATGLAAVAGQNFLYAIDVPPGRTTLDFNTGGGTGDADLYVKFGAIPTFAIADCKSEGSTTVESCTFTSPAAGTWYVIVNAYSDISGVNLTATYAPALATLSISDASVTEGNAGTKQLTFNINLSAPVAGPVSFDVATTPGTAFAGSDYLSASQAGVTIPAGQTAATFSVTINGDTKVEGNETFTVDLTNVTGAPAGKVQAQGRIINDDQASLSIGDASITEGNSGISTMVFDVQLSEPMPSPVTFDIATANGSATAGSDYVARSIAGRYLDAGRTRMRFEVAINGDVTAEANETFAVNISNVSGAQLADGAAVGTIVNDDGAALVGGGVATQSLLVSPIVLGFDGKPLVHQQTATCRPSGQHRGRRETALPTCGAAKAAAAAAAAKALRR